MKVTKIKSAQYIEKTFSKLKPNDVFFHYLDLESRPCNLGMVVKILKPDDEFYNMMDVEKSEICMEHLLLNDSSYGSLCGVFNKKFVVYVVVDEKLKKNVLSTIIKDLEDQVNRNLMLVKQCKENIINMKGKPHGKK